MDELGDLNRNSGGLSDSDVAEALQDIADTLGGAIDDGTFLPRQ